MNVRLAVAGMVMVFLIVSAGLGAAMSKSKTEEKISPLYKIRTLQSIKEKVGTLKASYLSNRIFVWSLLKYLLEKYKGNYQKFSTVCSICKTRGCRLSLPLNNERGYLSTREPFCKTYRCRLQLDSQNCQMISRVIAPSYCIKCQ